jgi:hypothetical protein
MLPHWPYEGVKPQGPGLEEVLKEDFQGTEKRDLIKVSTVRLSSEQLNLVRTVHSGCSSDRHIYFK